MLQYVVEVSSVRHRYQELDKLIVAPTESDVFEAAMLSVHAVFRAET